MQKRLQNKTFALIGPAGFVAKRHLQALKDNNCILLASYDIFDSVGILDSFFPSCKFFTSLEEFEEFLATNACEYLSICTPNYLHIKFVLLGIKYKMKIICEKPLFIDSKSFSLVPKDYPVYGILQLRLEEAFLNLKNSLKNPKTCKLIYITPRGDWYYKSWKSNKSKSGGILFNIGIHLFDVLICLFGEVSSFKTYKIQEDIAFGVIEFQNEVRVQWFLSTKKDMLKNKNLEIIKNTIDFKNLDLNLQALSNLKNLSSLSEEIIYNSFRMINIDGISTSLSKDFSSLHSLSYKHILEDRGFGLEECYRAVRLVEDLIMQDTRM